MNDILESARRKRSVYMAELANRIAPGVARYDEAIFDLRSRDAAQNALTDLADAISELSAAAVKGEAADFKPGVLESYWKLYTIFREAKYRDETL